MTEVISRDEVDEKISGKDAVFLVTADIHHVPTIGRVSIAERQVEINVEVFEVEQ